MPSKLDNKSGIQRNYGTFIQFVRTHTRKHKTKVHLKLVENKLGWSLATP